MHSNSSKSGKPHILGVALVCEIAISLWQGPFQNNFSFTHYLLVPCYFILRCPFFLSFFLLSKYLCKHLLLDILTKQCLQCCLTLPILLAVLLALCPTYVHYMLL